MDGPSATAATDAAACARVFAALAESAKPRAPLYVRLAEGIAADHELAGLLLLAPPTQRQPVLLLACVHFLLLDGRDHELARYYPNLTEHPDPGDPVPAFRAFCHANADELAELLATRSTQTNEIGRCALLLPVFGLLAAEVGDIAHLDVGTSAGLNLLLDRYEYAYEPGGEVGGPSPVRLECGTRGPVPVPPAMPPIVQRLRARPVAGRRPRPRPATLAGSLRLAGPDRPLRAAAGGARARRRRAARRPHG